MLIVERESRVGDGSEIGVWYSGSILEAMGLAAWGMNFMRMMQAQYIGEVEAEDDE